MAGERRGRGRQVRRAAPARTTGRPLASVTVLAPAPDAPGTFALEWGVRFVALDEHGREVEVHTLWCGAQEAADELLAVSARRPEVRAPVLVHRWVSGPRSGQAAPLPQPWEAIDTLVAALARATGQQEAVVRLGVGVA